MSSKELAGTHRNDRKKQASGDLVKLPRKPVTDLVNEQAKKFYTTVGKVLVEDRMISKSDLHAFCMACNWFGFYFDAYEETVKKGIIQTYKTGARNVSPEFTTMEKADAKLKDYFKYFGLTPYHRERILTATQGNKGNDVKSQEAEMWESVLSPTLN